jgi:hypothetical protein
MTIIISCIAIALVAFICFGFFKASELKKIQIIKSVIIKGSKEEVFDMARYLNNFPKWSPFLAADPAQKYEVKGKDGTLGAQYHWEGNGGKDLGFQEIVKIEELKFVSMRCDIKKPFVAKPTFDYYFTETEGGVEVKQDFKVESDLVSAFFMWLFGAKSEMAKMNQQGLDLMKIAVETKK